MRRSNRLDVARSWGVALCRKAAATPAYHEAEHLTGDAFAALAEGDREPANFGWEMADEQDIGTADEAAHTHKDIVRNTGTVVACKVDGDAAPRPD